MGGIRINFRNRGIRNQASYGRWSDHPHEDWHANILQTTNLYAHWRSCGTYWRDKGDRLGLRSRGAWINVHLVLVEHQEQH